MPLNEIAYAPYRDPDDFIREVTDRIWVSRDIGHIRENYEAESIVHGPLGTAVGVEQVVEGSMMRISQIPGHVGQAEDVIWEERGDDAFLSSHLVLVIDPVLTKHGPRNIRSRTIANCLYRRGRMVEEWVVRDGLAHAQQRENEAAEIAAGMTFAGYSGSFLTPPPVDVLACGDSGPRPDNYRPECELVLAMIDEVWNGWNLSAVNKYFVRDLTVQTVGDTTLVRPHAYQENLLTQIAPFPGARFEVRDIQTNYSPDYAGLRVAVMWKLSGNYTGVASYGPLTGGHVDVLGVSQFLIQHGRIVREVRIFDELGLRAQINAGRPEGEFAFGNLY